MCHKKLGYFSGTCVFIRDHQLVFVNSPSSVLCFRALLRDFPNRKLLTILSSLKRPARYPFSLFTRQVTSFNSSDYLISYLFTSIYPFSLRWLLFSFAHLLEDCDPNREGCSWVTFLYTHWGFFPFTGSSKAGMIRYRRMFFQIITISRKTQKLSKTLSAITVK